MKLARLAAAAAPVFLSHAPALADEVAIVHAGRLLATPGRAPLQDQSVIIRDGMISAVVPGFVDGDAAGAGPDDSVVVHDLRAMFVMPGLIDCHVHLEGELSPTSKLEAVERSDAAVALDAADNARKTLMAGFTTVRDVGSSDSLFAVRDAIAAGDFPGPRIYASGAAATPTGGHGDVHGYRQEILDLAPDHAVCDGAADCRRAVRDLVSRGADHIKLTATGGVLSETAAGTEVQFYTDELDAIITTGHLLGRKVTAHAHGARGINAALNAGVDSIEHGTYANEESFRLFRRSGAYLVPTILAGATVTAMATPEDTFMPPPIRAKALAIGPRLIEMVRNAHRAGVKIAFGTDTGVSRHGENAKEFALLVEAGMTPMDAIRAATIAAADNIGQSALLGAIEVGKSGDLVAVAGDPLADIRELEDIDFVMKGGVAFKSAE